MCSWSQADVTKVVTQITIAISGASPDQCGPSRRQNSSNFVQVQRLENMQGEIAEPELAREVERAVEREHLTVDTVFAMHQDPVAWSEVVGLLHKAA